MKISATESFILDEFNAFQFCTKFIHFDVSNDRIHIDNWCWSVKEKNKDTLCLYWKIGDFKFYSQILQILLQKGFNLFVLRFYIRMFWVKCRPIKFNIRKNTTMINMNTGKFYHNNMKLLEFKLVLISFGLYTKLLHYFLFKACHTTERFSSTSAKVTFNDR